MQQRNVCICQRFLERSFQQSYLLRQAYSITESYLLNVRFENLFSEMPPTEQAIFYFVAVRQCES